MIMIKQKLNGKRKHVEIEPNTGLCTFYLFRNLLEEKKFPSTKTAYGIFKEINNEKD